MHNVHTPKLYIDRLNAITLQHLRNTPGEIIATTENERFCFCLCGHQRECSDYVIDNYMTPMYTGCSISEIRQTIRS